MVHAWKRHIYRATVFLFTAMLSGCVFWHNFSTYFNTDYLAWQHLKAYEAEQLAIVAQSPNGAVALMNHRWLDEEYLIRQEQMKTGTADPITPSFSQSLSATKEVKNMHLDSAIILGSKILADKKDNKYKEDALFVVGKAQFYKNDFIGAERKFHELLAHYPQTEYGSEVRVLLARSMLINRQSDTAIGELQKELSSAAANDPAAASSIHRAMAELIYARTPDSLSGIASELHLAEQGLDGEERARLAYQEGAVYYLDGNWPSAERAFQLAYHTTGDDYLAGEARVGEALAHREEGNLEEAKNELAYVNLHVKYGGSQAAARYEADYTDELIARKAVHDDLHSPEFRTAYEPVLHQKYYALDTAYRATSVLIVSRIKFREAEILRGMGKYDSAAKLAAPLVGTKDFSSLAMDEYVSNRASSLASYAEWKRELDQIDSLKTVLAHTQTPLHPLNITSPGDEAVKIHNEALQEVLGSRWKPQSPVGLTKQDSTHLREAEARLKSKEAHPVVVTDTARFVDSLNLREGMAHYQIGRAYQTFGEVPDARAQYFTSDTMNIGPIDTGRTALRAQNMYAWLELEHQAKNKSAQDSLLHQLLTRYGGTIYAQEARILYGNSDKNSPGERAYLDAYAVLRQNGIDAAKPKFLAIAMQFPQEDVAPRSIYAIAESYEEVPHYDSALAYYKQVLRDYPYSTYALALRPRFADATAPPTQRLVPQRSEARNPSINSDDNPQSIGVQTPPNRRPFPNRPGMPPAPPPPGAPVPPVPPPIPSKLPPGAPTPPNATPPISPPAPGPPQ